jgi:hypothetical protein
MRSVRNVETLVLGYVIERLDRYDSSGNLESQYYEIKCPHTGNRLGPHANLRMAKRAVILHELRDMTLVKRSERERHEERQAEAA